MNMIVIYQFKQKQSTKRLHATIWKYQAKYNNNNKNISGSVIIIFYEQ